MEENRGGESIEGRQH